MKKLLLITAATFALATGAYASYSTSDPTSAASDTESSAGTEAAQQRLRVALEQARAATQAPGASAAVIFDDGRLVVAATGFADAEQGKAMRPKARLLAGSIGKTFVAATVMKLVEDGKISLDQNVASFFANDPWFGTLPNASDITVRMLLNHTSGLPEHVLELLKPQNHGFFDPDRTVTADQLLQLLSGLPPLFPAGTRHAYSDSNYILLGLLVERVTGRCYNDEVRRQFLDPLALRDTTPSDHPRLPSLAPGYTAILRNFINLPPKVAQDGVMLINPGVELTGGGLVSTPADLARWAKRLFEGSALPQARLDEMLQPVTVPGTTPGEGYGLGLSIYTTPLGTAYGHAGFFPGYRSAMFYFPASRMAVVVQMNQDEADAAAAALAIATEFSNPAAGQ